MRKLRQQSYGSTLFSGSSETMPWQNLKASRASRLATQGRLGALQAFNILWFDGNGNVPFAAGHTVRSTVTVAAGGAMRIPLERMQSTIQLDLTGKAIGPKPIPIIPEKSFLSFLLLLFFLEDTWNTGQKNVASAL